MNYLIEQEEKEKIDRSVRKERERNQTRRVVVGQKEKYYTMIYSNIFVVKNCKIGKRMINIDLIIEFQMYYSQEN